MPSTLITSAEYLIATGEGTAGIEVDRLNQIGWAISAGSTIIRNYLDRNVVLATEDTQNTRTFRYSGGNILEIDDATVITSVATTITPWSPATRVLDPTEYVPAATSANLPVFDYIELWTNLPFATSPAMGFKWNEDRYGWRPHPVELDVTAQWGWPTIPEDIKQAAIWQTADLLVPETPYISEAIEGYSHSMREARGTTNIAPINAVSARVQSLLEPYIRSNA